MMKLSIVTTLYHSSEYIEEFYLRISIEAKKITEDYEIIFVDDCGQDGCLEKAISLHKKDPRLTVIELSRNFGHHKAIMVGLNHCVGDFVFLIDSDLEESPELLGEFWLELNKSDDFDVIYGVQEKRKGGLFERASGQLYFAFFNYLSDVKIPRNFATIRLMKKSFVDNLVLFRESEVVFSVINTLNGFKRKPYLINKNSHSPSTYSLRIKLKLLFSTIISATPKPLWVVFNFGLLVTFFTSFYVLYLIYNKFINNSIIDGWTSVMVLISFFGGLIIFFLGVIGIYLSTIFIEVKQRPHSIIRKIYTKKL
jgi:putative glycosyltransferase